MRIYGDSTFSANEPVVVLDAGEKVVVDFSEYGRMVQALLRLPGSVSTFGAVLAAAPDEPVVWYGAGTVPTYEFGGDFSTARVRPGPTEPVPARRILEAL